MFKSIICYISSFFQRKLHSMPVLTLVQGHPKDLEETLISRQEVLMGRDAEFPLDSELELNLSVLLNALNRFRKIYNIPMIVSSGYRPGHYNKEAGGSLNSAHITCQACDFKDPKGELDFYCDQNEAVLEACGLWREHPTKTVGWCHLTTRRPASWKPGMSRTFYP